MQQLRRYLPLLGSAVLIASVVLESLGLTDLAQGLKAVMQLTGAADQSPVKAADLNAFAAAILAALASGTGIYLKLRAVFSKPA